MSTAPEAAEAYIQALPIASRGPDTAFNRLLGELSGEDLRPRLGPAAPPRVSWPDLNLPQPLPLETEERRLVQAFAYLLTAQKKSTPRFERMQALYQKYQSEDLAEMLLSYALAWYSPSEARGYGLELLNAHPASLGLRLNLSLLALSRQDPEDIAALLEQHLSWAAFSAAYPQLAATPVQVRLFHTITCLYFAQSGRFREAAHAYAICRDTGASEQELITLSHALERQLTIRDQWPAIVEWLRPEAPLADVSAES